MKKLIICLLTILILVGCQKRTTVTDGERFKQEYEALNGQKDSEGNTYSTIEIPSRSSIKLSLAEDVEELFLRGTHIVYLGWPSCGWCRRAIPVLIDTANEYSGINIYVYNIKQARDDFEAGKDSEQAKLYQLITSAIEYSEFDFDAVFERFADGTLRLPSSAVYFVQNGEIIGLHTRTVASHLDSFEPLTDNQISELKSIYKGYIEQMIKDNNPGCGDCD